MGRVISPPDNPKTCMQGIFGQFLPNLRNFGNLKKEFQFQVVEALPGSPFCNPNNNPEIRSASYEIFPKKINFKEIYEDNGPFVIVSVRRHNRAHHKATKLDNKENWVSFLNIL